MIPNAHPAKKHDNSITFRTSKNNTGFSLIELMACVMILTILSSMALPSYVDMRSRLQVKSEISKWQLAFALARKSAITSSTIVTLCPSSDALQCGKNWVDGAIIFVDKNSDHIKDADESIIQVLAPIDASMKVTWRAFQNKNYVQFKSNGFTWGQNGTLRICHSLGELKYNRALIVTRTGRIRLSQDNNGDGFDEDASGKIIQCG